MQGRTAAGRHVGFGLLMVVALAGCSERQTVPEGGAPARLHFASPVYTASEADSSVSLDLHRFPREDTLEASVAVLDGTARPQFDYEGLPQIVTFGEGDSVTSVRIRLVQNAVPESDEWLMLSVSALTPGFPTVKPDTTRLLILDDEAWAEGVPVFPMGMGSHWSYSAEINYYFDGGTISRFEAYEDSVLAHEMYEGQEFRRLTANGPRTLVWAPFLFRQLPRTLEWIPSTYWTSAPPGTYRAAWLASLPWTIYDVGWEPGSADTLLLFESDTLVVRDSVEYLGRAAVETPAGVFPDAYLILIRHHASYPRDMFPGSISAYETWAVVDSVGVVQIVGGYEKTIYPGYSENLRTVLTGYTVEFE